MELNKIFKNTLKGVMRAVLLTIILVVVLSIIMIFLKINSNIMNIIITSINCLGIVYGSMYAANKIEKKGWIFGIVVSLVYFVLMYALSKLLLGSEVNYILFNFRRMFLYSIIGMLSGMLGINI